MMDPQNSPPPPSPASQPQTMKRLGVLLQGRWGGAVAIALLMVILMPSMSLWRQVQDLETEVRRLRAENSTEAPTNSAAKETPFLAFPVELEAAPAAGEPRELPAGVGHLLRWPGSADFELYRISLVNGEEEGTGEQVTWSADAAGLPSPLLVLPPNALPTGSWILKVEGLRPGAEPQEIARSPLVVTD
ncbi:MAG: hypothetical protein AAGD01_09135 [Acidobacteriota bacterium]